MQGITAETPVQSISEQVFLKLKKQILSGELQPGTRLLVLQIAKQFDVSQAPVREALERLKQSGFITGVPNKGSVVSAISNKEIKDIFALREIIEGFAVKKTMETLTENDFVYLESLIAKMQAAHEQNDILKILDLDMEFHGFFYSRCDNQAIFELWNHMKQKVMRFMAVSNRYFTTDELAEWHMILIRSIRSGDPEVAAEAFVEHMHSYKTIHY